MRKRPDKQIPILVLALVMGMAPHILALPLWVNLWCFSLWGWIFVLHRKSWRVPPRWIHLVLAMVAFSVIIVTSRGRFDSDSGIGLLCLMGSIKPFEIKGHRDRMITLFLVYFMIVSSLFFSESLDMTVYLFATLIAVTGILIHVNFPDIPVRKGIRLSSVIVMQALPLALILFVVFPRIQGSLWGFQFQKKGSTGLSDTLVPGSVTELGRDDTVAFRVTFDGQAPSPSQMYWRAMVFDRYDGRRWRIDPKPSGLSKFPPKNQTVSYDVILEPHNQRWIFVLDFPVATPGKYFLLKDLTLRSRRKIITKILYTCTSSLTRQTGVIGSWDEDDLSLPDSGNPRARNWARSLRLENPDTEALVDNLLSYINENEYYYTLNPPPATRDQIDGFLFDSRRGYCEHYASAFVFIMRSAGIPARIVGGYHGGETNPYGDYIIIRQSFAHVWAEVWMDDRGWVRVDPTAAVNESRVDTESLALSTRARPENSEGESKEGFFDQAAFVWDVVNYTWYNTILGYSSDRQKRLLERYGLSLETIGGILKIFGISVLLTGCIVASYILLQSASQRKKADPIREIYRGFLKKMARVGIVHQDHEGPYTFAARCVTLRKDMAAEVYSITRLYTLIRYGGHDGDGQLVRTFKQQVRCFHPKKMVHAPSEAGPDAPDSRPASA